jgi:phosphoglycerate kinase
MSKNLKSGEVRRLENLRFYEGEEGKPRDLAEDASDEEKKAAKAAVKAKQKDFVKKLASYADCYINDAFGTAHRAHASTALIADYFPNEKMFGYVMEGEIKAIDKVMKNPARPFTAILGGSKVSSKIAIIEQLIKKVDNLIIGGGMTFTFVKAQGGKTGNSICEDDQLDLALRLLDEAKKAGVKMYFPEEEIVGDKFGEDANTKICPTNAIPDGWEGLDASPAAVAKWKDVILSSKTILWNGPVGVFEMKKFAGGTEGVVKLVAEATKAGAYSLVGGGDSVAAVTQMGYADKVSYVSTGGGALLEYMEGTELPGVKAIRG